MENLKKLKIYTISSCLHLSWQMQSEYSIYGQNVQCYVKQKTRPRFFLILLSTWLNWDKPKFSHEGIVSNHRWNHSLHGRFCQRSWFNSWSNDRIQVKILPPTNTKTFFSFFFLFRNCNIHKTIEIRRQGVKLVMRMHENIFGTHLDIYRMTQLLSL